MDMDTMVQARYVYMYIDYLRIINTLVPRSFEGTKVSVRLIVNVIHTDRE